MFVFVLILSIDDFFARCRVSADVKHDFLFILMA